jgi:hypothetical protein
MILGRIDKFLESPEGQKMVIDYLLSDNGKKMISQIISDPKGRSSIISLITYILDLLNLPVDQKELFKSALNSLA